MRFQRFIMTTLAVILLADDALAATSAINNHVRIFEDTLWLITFAMMGTAGLLLRRISGAGVGFSYLLLAFTGLLGFCWKGIGLVKRVLIINEPKWFFSVTRETFEGLTGIVLAISFITLVFAIRQVYRYRAG